MSSRLNEREIARLLAERDEMEPPAELLSRLHAEIPADVGRGLRLVAPAETAMAEVVRPRFWADRRVWLAAASVAVAVTGGFLALEVRRQAAAPEELELVERARPAGEADGPREMAAASPEAPAPPPAASIARPLAQERAGAARPDLEWDDGGATDSLAGTAGRENAAAPPPPPAARDLRAYEELRRRGELARPRPQAEPAQPVEVPEELGTVEDSITITGEAPAVDERKAVAGTVVGGVAGGVPGGTPGGVIGGVPSAPRLEQEALRVGRTPMAPSTGGEAEPNDRPYGDVFFESHGVNPFVDTEDDRLSTFGLDVDTASYTVVRRFLDDGHLPPPEAVRVEEMVNFFSYGDEPPRRGDFAIHGEGAPSPFAGGAGGERYRLLRWNLRAREVSAADRKPAALTFVVDVSGSMDFENRLGLVQQALGLLLDELRADDRVALVVYGSAGRVLLEHTSDKGAIRRAIDRLVAEGSTNAEEGLALGYGLAERGFRPGGVNRVILCSDGVANVGATGPDSILARIGKAADRGIELTTVGFGMGNYNDVLMERLADRGDGRYAYVDTLGEAERVFVEDLTGTLQTVAEEARVQVEFNPAVVSRWRLLGYENRDIEDHRFRDASVDAGEIGAGHSVTALYEIKLQPGAPAGLPAATLRLRWRPAGEEEFEEEARTVRLADLARSWESAPRGLKLASIVAEFAEILRRSYWAKDGDLRDLFRRAQRVSPAFPGDPRVAELANLIGRAARLSTP